MVQLFSTLQCWVWNWGLKILTSGRCLSLSSCVSQSASKFFLTYSNCFQWLKLQHNFSGLEDFSLPLTWLHFHKTSMKPGLFFLASPYPTESVDVTKPLVWRHVCQRLGKKESKICAGLSVLVINLCQSQVLVHGKKKTNNSFRVIVCFLPIAIDPVTPMRFCCLTADVWPWFLNSIWPCCLNAVRGQWRQTHPSDFFSPHKVDM